jgi:ankyrin repeat protein
VSETEPLNDPLHAGSPSERPPDGRPFELSDAEARAEALEEAVNAGHLDAALLYAVQLDNPTAVRQIVALGADVNHIEDATTGTTALHVAASANHSAVVMVLVEEGADPRARAATGAFFSPDIVEAHRLMTPAGGWTPEDVTRGNLDIWRDWRRQGHDVFTAEELDVMIARADETLHAFRSQ